MQHARTAAAQQLARPACAHAAAAGLRGISGPGPPCMARYSTAQHSVQQTCSVTLCDLEASHSLASSRA